MFYLVSPASQVVHPLSGIRLFGLQMCFIAETPHHAVLIPIEVPLDPFEKDASAELDTFKEPLGTIVPTAGPTRSTSEDVASAALATSGPARRTEGSSAADFEVDES